MSFSFSIIIETENLGMAGLEDLKDTIASLEAQTYDFRTAKEIIIIAAEHVSNDSIKVLKDAYPWITIHKADHDLEYIETKKMGAQIATGDIIVYVDSDVVYESTWLENILRGFEIAPGAAIISGDTRIRGTSIYATAIQLVWMMDAETRVPHIHKVEHFDLNNFAIKREIMLQAPLFLGLPIYRAATVETRKQLYFKGYSAMRVPHARAFHMAPTNFIDWLLRIAIYGADAVAKADFYFKYNAQVIEKFSPLRRLLRIPMFLIWKIALIFRRAYIITKEEPRRIPATLCAIPLSLLFMIIITSGSIIALFKRDYIFNKIIAHESKHIV